MSTARPALNANGDLAYSILQQGAGVLSAYNAVMGSALQSAKSGLDVGAELSGSQHFGDLANREITKSWARKTTSGTATIWDLIAIFGVTVIPGVMPIFGATDTSGVTTSPNPCP